MQIARERSFEVHLHPHESIDLDIDLDDPETAKAATKIQSSFRGSQARKEVQAMKEKKEESSKIEEEVCLKMGTK